MKPRNDAPLSDFAFNFNFRRYTKAAVLSEDNKHFAASFNRLDSYKAALEANNPGSVMRVNTTSDSEGVKTFLSTSVASALAAKFYKKGCQQIVGVDGAHIKSKLYNHQMLMQTTLFAGFVFPLAVAIYPNESKEGYNLLFSTAAEAGIDINDNVERTVCIADRHKGIIASMNEQVGPSQVLSFRLNFKPFVLEST